MINTSSSFKTLHCEGQDVSSSNPKALQSIVDQGSQWFLKVVLPMLRRKFPVCVDWATALISGSLSFGKADEYSDFDGRLYLPGELYHRFGTSLSQEMEACSRPNQPWSYAVLNQDEPTPLCRLWRNRSDRRAWLEIDEGHLYYVSHWILVYDPKDIAQSFQRETRYYPEDVYPLRLRDTQVNLSQWRMALARAVSRRDHVTAHIAMGAFLAAAMRLGFLFKRQYGPWAKWMYEAFLDLPDLGKELGSQILRAVQIPDVEQLPRIAETIEDYYQQHIPDWPHVDENTVVWTIDSEPPQTGEWQEHLASLWYALSEWAEGNLNKAMMRTQEVASYLYLTSSLLKVLYFGFYVLQQHWPGLLDLHRAFRGLGGPVHDIVPLIDEMMQAHCWEERQALMERILSIYREYMRQEAILPEQCIDTPAWVWSWLEHRKEENGLEAPYSSQLRVTN